MILPQKILIPVVFALYLIFGKDVQAQTGRSLTNKIKQSNGLVALWDFKEKEGLVRKAYGKRKFPLKEHNGTIPRINEGPLSGYSALFGNKAFLSLPNGKTAELNIFGKDQGITIMAWVKWKGSTGFVGGLWNKHQDGGKRQYGLFVSLPYYNGANQVCGHISHSRQPKDPGFVK